MFVTGALSMDGSEFDVATQRLSDLLSRRRSLGVLAALGLSAGVLADDADAKHGHKKHKKHKKPKNECKTCTACETCVKGTCQPVADKTACGVNGICRHNVCARTCTFDFLMATDDCPAGSFCAELDDNGKGFCTTYAGDSCIDPACASDAACSAGEACIELLCDVFPEKVCAPVLPA